MEAGVAHPLELEPRRVTFAQRLEQALAVRLSELLPLGQLGLQRPQLRARTSPASAAPRSTTASGVSAGVRRTEPPPLLLRRTEARLRDEPLVLGPLLGHLSPQRRELLLGLGPGGRDLFEGSTLGERDGAGLGRGLRVRPATAASSSAAALRPFAAPGATLTTARSKTGAAGSFAAVRLATISSNVCLAGALGSVGVLSGPPF